MLSVLIIGVIKHDTPSPLPTMDIHHAAWDGVVNLQASTGMHSIESVG